MDKKELPVSARFFEELEMLSALHKSCEIIYRSENGGRTVTRDRIAVLYREGGVDWLRTGSGLLIRLQALEQVDGMTASETC
jgi:hypothetical protein